MKRQIITIYSLIICLVFLVAISFLGINLFHEYKCGSERSHKLFDSISRSIKENGDQFDYSKINDNFDSFEAVCIKKNTEKLVLFPNEYAENVSNTKLVRVYSVDIQNNEDTYKFKAAMYIMRPSVIFYYARYSFIVIMIATLLTAILLIYFSIAENPSEAKIVENNDEEETSSETVEASSDVFENITEEHPEPETTDVKTDETVETVEIDPVFENITEENSEQEVEFKIESSEEPTESGEPILDNSEINFDEPVEEAKTEASSEPVYSPVTGAVWQNQLNERLEKNIVKAASDEMDLSLFIMKIPGLEFTQPITSEVYKALLEEVQYKENIYEYESDSFAFVMKNMNIDEAEDFAEKVQSKVIEILATVNKESFIGISSRSIRMLSSDRLIMEASEALKHASEDQESAIIGFHVDIEKYREFIKNNG